MDIYTLGYNKVLLHFVAQTVPSFTIGSFVSWLLFLQNASINAVFCLLFWALPYFWALKDTLGLSCIFLAPLLELSICLKRNSFYWSIVLKNQDVSIRYACCYWGIISFGPFLLTRERNTRVDTCVATSTNTSICNYLYG